MAKQIKVPDRGNIAYESDALKKVAIIDVGDGDRAVISGNSYPLISIVEEAFDVYENKKATISTLPLHYESKMEIVELAKEGVKGKSIEKLVELLNVTRKEAAAFFHFSERALNNYIKNNTRLDPDTSEKILKMFALYLIGMEVFGTSDSFISWLTKPSFGLREKKPISLLSSSDGIDLVEEELSRIKHGDFA